MNSRVASEASLRARVDAWTLRLKVRPTQIRFQTMTRKWASCSTAGRITFCRELTQQPPSFQEFVVAHELLHLRIRNHGRLFESTLRAHLPGNPWIERRLPTSSRMAR